MARPRVYDDATRRELVQAAGALLAERGAGAVSVRAVAEAVGASTSAIYALFGSKAELVRAMFRAGFETLAAELEAVPVTDVPARDLLQLGLAYRRSALAEPHLYRVMFGGAFPGFVPDAEDAALAEGTLEVLRRSVERVAADRGLSEGVSVDDVTLGLWAQVHGLASLELAGALKGRGEPFWRQQLRATFSGLAVSSPG